MEPLEKIVAAFEKEKNALYIRDLIEGAGLAAVQLCRSGMEVRRLVRRENYCAVVCGYKLPDGSAEALFEDLPPGTSMLMVAAQHQLELCGEEGIFKLPAPIHREELLSAVHVLLQLSRRAQRFVPAQREGDKEGALRQAKALLMTRHGMSEQEAHRFLQKRSMDLGVSMAQVARTVLEERN